MCMENSHFWSNIAEKLNINQLYWMSFPKIEKIVRFVWDNNTGNDVIRHRFQYCQYHLRHLSIPSTGFFYQIWTRCLFFIFFCSGIRNRFLGISKTTEKFTPNIIDFRSLPSEISVTNSFQSPYSIFATSLPPLLTKGCSSYSLFIE